MYRSFVTCDDPKGVVECGTFRIHRTCSRKMKDKIKIKKTTENFETNLMNKRYKEGEVTKGSDENFIGPSSLHLIQVSRGDQSLKNMIDSWSSDLMYDGRSEDAAKDLFKGGLDMQDSLIMIRKLEEASKLEPCFKRKQTEKPKRDKIEAKMSGRMQANQFIEQSNPKGFQRPQSSADGSSSNCTEELKKVIKESLVRQKYLFPSTNSEGLKSASETPSTSPCQSSGVRTEGLADPSFSQTASKTERGHNLVAKLMGLEEAPSRSFSAAMQKHWNGEKIMNQKRPVFEIDMPEERKNNSKAEKVNPEQKTPVHFKGLMNRNFVKEPKLQVHHFNDSNSKQFDDLSHILLMKPQSTPYRESVKTRKPVPPEELSMRKLKAEAVSSKIIPQRKGSSSTNMGKEMEKDVSKRLTKEKGPEFLKEVVKLDAKGTNLTAKSSGKVKLYCHVSRTSQVNETIDKKCKARTISRKLPEKDISEPIIVARPQDQQEITSTKLRKPQSGSRIDKNEISCLNSTDSNTISISKTESQKNNSKDLRMEVKECDSVVDYLKCRKNQIKNRNPFAEPKSAKPIAKQIGLREEKKSMAAHGKDNYTEIRITTTQANELMMGREADAYANKIGVECKRGKSSSSDDIMVPKSEHENDFILAEEARESTNRSETDSNPDKVGAELKHFLSTSESIIRHAEKLFNLDVDCPKILQKDETNEISNFRLYLDCANELTELTSLEEIHDAIENLKFYHKNSGEKLSADKIFAMMEKDIKCNGLINGIWERGWRHGFSADEAERVVNKVENLIILHESTRGSLVDKKIKGLQSKIDESPWCMGEIAPKIGSHHTLPPIPIHTIKFLLDMGSNRDAIRNIIEIKGMRSRGLGLDLHLHWHV